MPEHLRLAVSLASLTGTWRRRWIRWPGGREDATTRVWWVQAGRYYGDLRLPANADAAADATETAEGFAGELVESQDIFHWRRNLDLRPTGKADMGRLRYTDASMRVMIEEGAEEPYVELWERVGSAEAPLALRLDPANGPRGATRGWFVAAGEHFVLATQGNGNARPEISYGLRDPGGANGKVVASSDPRRAATRAFSGDPLTHGWTRLAI
jgi:hypothetical protein